VAWRAALKRDKSSATVGLCHMWRVTCANAEHLAVIAWIKRLSIARTSISVTNFAGSWTTLR
jgi:hypothetical protein